MDWFWFIVALVSLTVNVILFEKYKVTENALIDLQMYMMFDKAFNKENLENPEDVWEL